MPAASPLHPCAADGHWHYTISYHWAGQRGDGGMDSIHFRSQKPLSSVPAMEHLMAAIRQRHAGCCHAALLHIWPLEHGDQIPADHPAPIDSQPPSAAIN